LDEPSGDDFAGSVFALTGLHFVAHEDADYGFVAAGLGADAHGICHDFSPIYMCVVTVSVAGL
jgi:hypothetical protein